MLILFLQEKFTLSLAISGYKPLSPAMSRHVITATFRPLMNGAPGESREAVDALISRISERPEVLGVVPAPAPLALRALVVSDRALVSDRGQDRPCALHTNLLRYGCWTPGTTRWNPSVMCALCLIGSTRGVREVRREVFGNPCEVGVPYRADTGRFPPSIVTIHRHPPTS